jgi:trans-aconitate methyltransferase
MDVRSVDDWDRERAELLAGLREFAELLPRAPFENREGLRGVSAFALYWFVRRVRPTAVFEVGVWRGFSTWLIEQAAPEAEVHCVDPMFHLEAYLDQEKLGATYRSPRATYSTQDFSCAGIDDVVARNARCLAFFDDHQNKLPRLLQAQEAGIRHLVFDDNTVDFHTHRTLEQERRDPAGLATLERTVERYDERLWHSYVTSVRLR